MAKRKKDQGLNFIAAAYKRIMLNGGAKGPFDHKQLTVMLKAADRLALMDKVFSAEQLAAADAGNLSSSSITEDQILADMRAKHQGGVHANTTGQ
jgi:hypothetical protein